MNHLRPEEMSDALEGVLPLAHQAHVDACDECRAQLAELRGLIEEARAATVPEPSPLFWDQFSRRVRAAIDAGDQPRVARWAIIPWWRRAFALPAVAALLAIVLVVAVWRADGPAPSQRATRLDTDVSSTLETPEAAGEDWNLVLSVAQDADWDTASEAGLAVRPGAAEDAIVLLSQDEQRELVRLLREELNHPVS
jgi:hypothetical protein